VQDRPLRRRHISNSGGYQHSDIRLISYLFFIFINTCLLTTAWVGMASASSSQTLPFRGTPDFITPELTLPSVETPAPETVIPVPSDTAPAIVTETQVIEITVTDTPQETVTSLPTLLDTSTPEGVPTQTLDLTLTSTLIEPSTSTSIATPSPTITFTPSGTLTSTFTPSQTPTHTPSNTATATKTLPLCTSIPLDVILVIDHSTSMEDLLPDAKQASKGFVGLMDLQNDQIGLVSFASAAHLDQQLTQNESAITQAIDSLRISSGTNIAEGLREAQVELISTRHNILAARVMILLSDGRPSMGNTVAAAQAAKQTGSHIITIGWGSPVNESLMRTIASSETDYYRAPNSSELFAIYQSIAQDIRCETPIPTLVVTPTLSLTPTKTSTRTPSRTPSITVTPSRTATPTVTSTVTETFTPSLTHTPTQTATITATLTKTLTATITPTTSRTPTQTPSSTTNTFTPSSTATSTRTLTPTATFTPSPTPTHTPSPTSSPTSTATSTPSLTPTYTPSKTTTLTATVTQTQTPTATNTASRTPTHTPSQTPTSTLTSTQAVVVAVGPSHTLTLTPSPSATSTSSYTPTRTPSNTATITTTALPPENPMLIGPIDGKTLPQPILPNQWHFVWYAASAPCHSIITIDGPDGQLISTAVEGSGGQLYEYVYSQKNLIPNDKLVPWSWQVVVVCPSAKTIGETQAFSVMPSPPPVFISWMQSFNTTFDTLGKIIGVLYLLAFMIIRIGITRTKAEIERLTSLRSPLKNESEALYADMEKVSLDYENAALSGDNAKTDALLSHLEELDNLRLNNVQNIRKLDAERLEKFNHLAKLDKIYENLRFWRQQ
jgi:hypothetical protein